VFANGDPFDEPAVTAISGLLAINGRIRKLTYKNYTNGSADLLELERMLHNNTTLTTLDVRSFQQQDDAAYQDAIQAIVDGVHANTSLTCAHPSHTSTQEQDTTLLHALQRNIRALLDNANADPFRTPVHLPDGLSVA